MRIVGGRHRGRRLLVPPGEAVRPTSDRVREALFDILSHGRFASAGNPFAAAAVLDAFAGTGALGLEALSRGAAKAVFIERDGAVVFLDPPYRSGLAPPALAPLAAAHWLATGALAFIDLAARTQFPPA